MKFSLSLFAIGLFFISCQKEIDVDLNDANPQVVIEAIYTAEDSTVRVHVSKTSSFFDNATPPSVDNATVVITDQFGNSSSVNSIGNGDYLLTNYAPQFNTTYNMTVVVDGTTYQADCKLNQPVALEDITYTLIPGFFGSDSGYVANLRFYDPVGVVNYYAIVLSLNGEEYNELTEIFRQDDLLSDGNFVERPMFGVPFYNMGDTIGMELRSIDEPVYDYLNEIISIAGAGQSAAAPANPTSNWNNKALGYFNAYGNSRKTVVIQ